MNRAQLLELPVRHRLLFLLALGALLYLPGLGQRELWYPDEPDIGEITQAMYRSGDLILPHRMGEVWLDYPPMVYWGGVGTSALLGGVSEYSLRLACALPAIALVLVTSLFVGRWFGRSAGLWSGVLLLAFPQFAYEAVSYRPDLYFTLFLGSAVLLYADAFGERVRWGPRIAAFALLGLAILSKGPLGLLLPGLVLTLWHLGRREWRRVLELAPLSLVALAVALPWYVAVAHAQGTESLLNELWGQNFERFTGAAEGRLDRGHIEPFHYYLVRVWSDLLPWSLLLPTTIWWTFRSGRWRDPRVQLALWWWGTFFVFLSFAATKRQVYLLPAYPAAALLLGIWVSRVGRASDDQPPAEPRHLRRVGAAFAVVLGIIGVAALVGAVATDFLVGRLELDPPSVEVAAGLRGPLFGLAVVGLGSAAWLAMLCYRRATRRLLRVMQAALIAVLLMAFTVVMPGFGPAKNYSEAGAWLDAHLPPEQTFGLANGRWDHGWRKRGGFGYYSDRNLELLQSRPEVEEFLRREPDSLVLVYEDLIDEVLGGEEQAWRPRVMGEIRAGRYIYLAVRAPDGAHSRQDGGSDR